MAEFRINYKGSGEIEMEEYTNWIREALIITND